MDTNKPGRTIGIKEIAKSANVAIATVDRVIHNRPGVSQKTKDRINAIIKKLDYQPNILARRLASRKILQIGVLMPHTSGLNYWSRQLEGIEEAESEIKQYGIKIHKYFFDPGSSQSFVKKGKELLQKKMDAVLLIPTFTEEARNIIKSCKQKGIPFAFLNADLEGDEKLFYIGPHLYQSGYQAAQLLTAGISEGKVLIVNIIGAADNKLDLATKEEGFRAFFKEHGIGTSIISIDIRSIEADTVDKRMKRVFDDHADIRAVFVTNSRVSLVAESLAKNGRRNTTLVGYDFLEDNINFLKEDIIDFLICQKLQEQGYRAIQTLYQKLVFNAEVEKIYYMPIDIVTRENYIYYNN